MNREHLFEYVSGWVPWVERSFEGFREGEMPLGSEENCE